MNETNQGVKNQFSVEKKDERGTAERKVETSKDVKKGSGDLLIAEEKETGQI